LFNKIVAGFVIKRKVVTKKPSFDLNIRKIMLPWKLSAFKQLHTFLFIKMELELTRVDYTLVGITLQNSLKLLPTKKAKEQQKFVIGDQDGVVQLLSAKKDEATVHFKTVPGEKIASIQLGGSQGSVNDKIFVANENQIIGYNKKGKVFLTFDTNLTEPIKSLFVAGNDLIVCGNHVYTHYKDCKESGSYLCGDTIVDCNVLCPNNASRVG
jgi:Bardet-Biedl syndrome 7 protein